jgi:ABC-type phosphate transport system substrate-binding protein
MNRHPVILNFWAGNQFLIFACWVWLTAGSAQAQSQSADVAIVVNPACSLTDVSLPDLAKIFKAQRTKTPDGNKFVLTSRETGSPERESILSAVYQMSDPQYEKYFLAATFAGTIQSAPKVIVTGVSVCQFVASEPGAIGYLRATETDNTVKVLKVEGKAPGDPNYPIKMK